ncbi:MAG: DUF4384 domain-containing protein [Pyrinomonadaceae bacterium]|nr:DUF4384 domain-containing protein [Pyrinomonadaceae bacterium]
MIPGRKPIPSRHILNALVMTLCVASLPAAVAQQPQEEETTRQLWDTAFIKQGNKAAAARKPARRNYRIVTPQVPVTGVSADTVIGVTLWRLRPTRPADTGERIITHDGPESVEWLPERVSSTGRLSEGDRIRISIEAARTGYLYVVDQEIYADGSKGEPFLIFPTTRTRGGDNSVKAGRVIEIPSQDDSPPYFTLKRTRVDHVGENVIVLVTPTPIEGLGTSDKALRLSDETLASWEKSWGAQTGRLEMANGNGKPWTRQEKEAGADGTRSLKADEPAPQTIYYRPGASSTVPVLVKVELQYAQKRPPVKRRQ